MMFVELKSLLDLYCDPVITARVFWAGIGFALKVVWEFCRHRWLNSESHPEMTRSILRQKARWLVLKAFLEGRRRSIWFFLVYIFHRARERHVLNPIFKMRKATAWQRLRIPAKTIRGILRCDHDDQYLPADAAILHEQQLLKRLAEELPENLNSVRLQLNQSSQPLAEKIQAVYEGLMSQHPELVVDELRRQPNDIVACLDFFFKEQRKQLKGRIRCMGKRIVGVLGDLAENLKSLVQIQRQLPAPVNVVPVNVAPPPGSSVPTVINEIPNGICVLVILSFLGILVIAGIEIFNLYRHFCSE